MKCINCGKEINFSCGTPDMAGNYCQTCWGKLRERSNTRNYVNMLNRENSELLVNSLAEKDKQIVELQKQLEEKEKMLEEYKKCNCEECMTDYEKNLNQIIDKYLYENNSLKQQLKSQPAEIVEVIKQTVKNNLVYPDNRIDCPFNDGYSDEETLCSIMDKVLQEYQKWEN